MKERGEQEKCLQTPTDPFLKPQSSWGWWMVFSTSTSFSLKALTYCTAFELTDACFITWSCTQTKASKIQICQLRPCNWQGTSKWGAHCPDSKYTGNRLLLNLQWWKRPCLGYGSIHMHNCHRVVRWAHSINWNIRFDPKAEDVYCFKYSWWTTLTVLVARSRRGSPCLHLHRRLKTVAWITATLLPTLLLLILGNRCLSAHIERYTWMVWILHMYLDIFVFIGSKVVYLAHTANLSMCFSSLAIYTTNGMIEGCFFMSPICRKE